VHDIDYTGAQGGALAMAFAAGATFAGGLMLAIGGFIWRVFGDARIKELQTSRAEDHERCEREIEQLRDRIIQLETLLLLHGPQALRQSMQAALSETHLDLDNMKQK
jgi:hypothetical protein